MREDKAVNGLSPIQLNWQNGAADRFSLATGESILAEHWNNQSQEAEHPARKKTYSELNKYLSSLKAKIERIEKQAKFAEIEITKDFVKSQLKPEKKVALKTIHLLDAFAQFIETAPDRTTSTGEKIKEGTIKVYISCLNHLLLFKSSTKYKLEFENINQVFSDKFTNYMLTEVKLPGDVLGLTNNTIGKTFKTLRTFLNWSVNTGINTNTEFKKCLKVWTAPSDIIYLTSEEYQTLYDLDLSAIKRLESVRDAFCLACASALRYQDVKDLRWEHIKKDYIQLTTDKTGQKARIPLNDYSRGILEKYQGKEFPLTVITNQKSNKYLKELGKKAGFIEMVERTRYKGKERIRDLKPKYEYLSFHDARRTFVTLSLENGMSPYQVMEITGHTDYKMVEKYIKLNDKVLQASISKAWTNPNKKVITA